MMDVDYGTYSEVIETKSVDNEVVARKPQPQSKPVVSSSPANQPKMSPQPVQKEEDIKERLEALMVDSIVHHKKFGKGTVVKLDKNAKFIHVKFVLGEKKFVYPDAFLMGFIECE